MHKWNKKIDSTFKLLAHASIKLYKKKEELLDTKCQISKHQQFFRIIALMHQQIHPICVFWVKSSNISKTKRKKETQL